MTYQAKTYSGSGATVQTKLQRLTDSDVEDLATGQVHTLTNDYQTFTDVFVLDGGAGLRGLFQFEGSDLPNQAIYRFTTCKATLRRVPGK